MRRTISETQVGDNTTRYRTRIEDDPSQQNSWDARQHLYNLLGTVVNCPDLINCGLNAPQKISIFHTGQFWVLEAEATLDQG